MGAEATIVGSAPIFFMRENFVIAGSLLRREANLYEINTKCKRGNPYLLFTPPV